MSCAAVNAGFMILRMRAWSLSNSAQQATNVTLVIAHDQNAANRARNERTLREDDTGAGDLARELTRDRALGEAVAGLMEDVLECLYAMGRTHRHS